jgi:heat shock protein HslJ
MLSRTRLVRLAGLLALTAVVAAACNTAGANKNSGLANTDWLLSTIEGSPVASGTNATLGFGLAEASGFSGCNQFSTTYQTDGSRGLTFGNFASTRMACDPAANAFETKYFASLAKVARYGMAGGNLTLLDRENSAVLTFAPQAAGTIEGPWTVTAVNNGKGAVATVPQGVSAAISFFADGHLEGYGGCNDFSGSYTLKGDTITFGPLMSQMKACPDPAGSFEQEFFAALAASTKWAVANGTLDLRDGGGAQQVAANSAIGGH